MHENEVIVVDGIPNHEYDSLISNCVKYAIISLPFTVNRMLVGEAPAQVLNIAKGKIAEKLLEYFCSRNGLSLNFNACATPFWTVDNRDFILNNAEWDIKNNSVYSAKELLDRNYTDLPALVPNRFSPIPGKSGRSDQWGKREQRCFDDTKDVAFLFTFMKSAGLHNGQRGEYFLEIVLSGSQIDFLKEQCSIYGGQLQVEPPFSEMWFWNEMNKRGEGVFFNSHFQPALIITGYANSSNWHLFKDTGPGDVYNNFQTYQNTRWYNKTSKGSLNFMEGTLWTKIVNATTPVSQLPSFLSLFPQLKSEMVCGRIRPGC